MPPMSALHSMIVLFRQMPHACLSTTCLSCRRHTLALLKERPQAGGVSMYLGRWVSLWLTHNVLCLQLLGGGGPGDALRRRGRVRGVVRARAATAPRRTARRSSRPCWRRPSTPCSPRASAAPRHSRPTRPAGAYSTYMINHSSVDPMHEAPEPMKSSACASKAEVCCPGFLCMQILSQACAGSRTLSEEKEIVVPACALALPRLFCTAGGLPCGHPRLVGLV